MPAYELIAVDVDGTLLTSSGDITVRTRSALERALAGGARLAVATGRRRRTAEPILERLGLPHFLISSQGAAVWQDSLLLAHSHLPAAGARRALEIIRRHGMVTVILGNTLQEEVIWVDGDWSSNERVAQYLKQNVHLVQPFSPEAFAHDPVEFIVMDTIGRLEQVDKALTGRIPPPPSEDPPIQEGRGTPEGLAGEKALWRVIFSRNQFTAGGAIEVVGPDTSKASGLAFLCTYLQITPEQVIAFGDNVNDVEMLEFAGLGVAMGNSTPEARAAAERLAPTNDEDGIAVVLAELELDR